MAYASARWRSLIGHLLARGDSAEPAFTFVDRDRSASTLRWSELATRVGVLSTRLRAVAGPGDRVAVPARQDLGYVIGFLAALHAGLVAVPLTAPRSRAQRARLVAALRDCAPALWLTTEAGLPRLREFADAEPVPAPARIITTDTDTGTDAVAPATEVGPDSPAYLQYTSGSTREPAAAVISHGALIASVDQVATAYEAGPATTCAGWIPFSHDMGLIQLLCLPLYTGARSVFMEPLEFVRAPRRWLELLSDYPEVFTAAPNFAFDFAVDTVPAATRTGLDLSGVRVALNGSEPIRPATITAFAEAYRPYGFRPEAHRPSYGLAEATVYVSSAGPEGPTVTAFDRARLAAGSALPAASAEQAGELVSVGRPVGQLVRVVHPETHRLEPNGTIGEIWVHGPHLASGYWRRPERTAETFEARIAAAPADLPEHGWLRTGDLGVVHDGQLYITGRRKDLIIVDGSNHYPQDIESTVAGADPTIRRDRVAAFGVADAEGEGVMVVAEYGRDSSDATLDPDRIGRTVRRAVTEQHDIVLREFLLVAPGEVPRTSSGKVARAAARARFWPAR
ncbi:fatty acyl-AMP ligase [Amycolatopsis cihanbeyliensis]|uniref:Acyl-CoA synthetase (AMP-forming)/AMP-acid ligase II n=1 Tax=Amycolatopsis cihanbeyliensis TaxID=1128664 RepID=A0A542DJ98_AMYCI|nr:fatty acyl-AMP ligase [Amycolatopsis cihanbeyliensis]TQJ03136.1 acyl-CoA synthetase (AMP-forming)/AMP-acid ligase II [Amycolatopsis cihanbeyliensis]